MKRTGGRRLPHAPNGVAPSHLQNKTKSQEQLLSARLTASLPPNRSVFSSDLIRYQTTSITHAFSVPGKKSAAEIERLEAEARAMEERLKTIKTQLQQTREQRQVSKQNSTGLDAIWGSGKSGALHSHATNVLLSRSKKTVGFKGVAQQADEIRENHINEIREHNGKGTSFSEITSEKEPEQKHSQSKSEQKLNDQPTTISSVSESLLDGEYDEEANKASFAEALKAWRESRQNNISTTEENESQVPSVVQGRLFSLSISQGDKDAAHPIKQASRPHSSQEHATSTVPLNYEKILEEFSKPSSTSLSYLDKLALQRLRAEQHSWNL